MNQNPVAGGSVAAEIYEFQRFLISSHCLKCYLHACGFSPPCGQIERKIEVFCQPLNNAVGADKIASDIPVFPLLRKDVENWGMKIELLYPVEMELSNLTGFLVKHAEWQSHA